MVAVCQPDLIIKRLIDHAPYRQVANIAAAFNHLGFRGSYSATSNNTKLVHWPLMDGLLHLVQR